MDEERTQARGAHLIARDERLWLVEPKLLTENTAKFVLNEVVGVRPEVIAGGMDETTRLAKAGVMVGDFSFDKVKGNAVTLTSATRLHDVSDSQNEDHPMMRVLSERRIDTQLARERDLGRQFGQDLPRQTRAKEERPTLGRAAAMMDWYENDRKAQAATDPERTSAAEPKAGVFGGLKRMLTGSPEAIADRTGAAEQKAALLADRSIEGRFAVDIAQRFAGKPMEEVAKAMPEAWSREGLPTNHDAAFVAIAKTARRMADRHMAGPSGGLDEEHAREAKERALVSTLYFNKSGQKGGQSESLADSMEDFRRSSIQAMRRELNPEIAPKPMRPGPQPAVEVSRPMQASKGAVAAMHMQQAARSR